MIRSKWRQLTLPVRFLNGHNQMLPPLLFLCPLVFCTLFLICFLCVYRLLLKHHQNTNSLHESSENSHFVDYEVHKLAVIVPYRDRWEQLQAFVPYISLYLRSHGINFIIYVVQQLDRYRFNRGALLNVGYLYARERCDYLALHDVDLLPNNPKISYSYPSSVGPIHVAAPQYHPFYNFEKYFGGIILIRNEHFEQVNGFANKFWGWGLEDDEFRLRIVEAGYVIQQQHLKSGSYDSFLHLESSSKRDKQGWDTLERRIRDRIHGYRDVNMLEAPSVSHNSIKGHPYTLIDVKFRCNVTETPWCMPEWYT